ncbi:MAG: DUF3105 domain-containing protein [Solirubrobacterales bacterium]
MASRKEEKERRRQERQAAEQAADQQSKQRRTYGIVIGAVLVLAVIGAVIAIVAASGGSSGKKDDSGGPHAQFDGAVDPPPLDDQDLFSAAEAAGCKLENPPIAGRSHVPSSKKVVYKTNPPTSGDHDALAQPDGVYTKEPQPRHLIHALEGGRVEIHYKPDIPARRLDQLGGFFNQNKQFLLLFPNSSMPYDVAISSWGHLAGCKKITDATFDVIRDFYDRYVDQAPEGASGHQPSVGAPGWPGEIPPFHQSGAIPGS